MMSGSSLVLLAMHATVNAVGPAGAAQAHGRPMLLVLLFAAATLSTLGVIISNGPHRPHVKGSMPVRSFSAPRDRRR